MATDRDPRTLRMIGQLSSLGLAFVFAIVLGFAGGLWLDGRLGTRPWLSLTGFALGLVAGILNVVRTMRVLERDRLRGVSQGRTGPGDGRR